MATGISGYFDLTGNYGVTARVSYTESFDASGNFSILPIDLQIASSWYSGVTYYLDGTISINGETIVSMSSAAGSHSVYLQAMNTYAAVSGSPYTSGKIVHNDNGIGEATISVNIRGYTTSGGAGSGWSVSGSKKVVLTTIPTYSLSVSSGEGSTVTVVRTSSGYAPTGSIETGAKLYYGDNLKITFSAKSNYALSSHTVNNNTFTSGNTHNVTGNVSIVATAQVLASDVGATDANIGSTSTITVTKYNANYCHTLQYTFGDLSGYITSSGEIQSEESKLSDTSIAFKIPTSFYSQIPNSKTGVCTIICRTYINSSSTTVLGNATACTFTVTATSDNCAPILSVSVEDTNEITKALTGNSATLIRYKSTAMCTISATSRNSSEILNLTVAGTDVTGTTSGDIATATKSFVETDKTSFKFSATDSRGYITTETVSPLVVAYVKLTCNPVITRPASTGSSIVMTFSGNIYRGSFGAYSNTLTIRYRYKEEGGSYCLWKAVDNTCVTFGTSTYRSSTSVSLGEDFDYSKAYVFQVQAIDGASDYPLSTVTQTVPVNRGVPVMDWGEHDFNFNVPVNMNGKDVFGLPYPSRDSGAMTKGAMLDLTYPVGSIYMSTSSTSPASLFGGTWERITQRFLFAADGGGGFPSGTTGGEATHTLTYDEIPAHWHYVYVYCDYPASTTVPSAFGMISNSNLNWSASERTGKHRAGYGFTDNAGGGKSHNNMPPYLAVYMWKRVA